ncbi:MAG TPA: winged helix-turn-helix domain-containing protein [Solirubrobacterales bacterium]|nr:winged helix-turn-helix domain-containing protein [Solirubrobacterales bacterium]
MRDIELSDYLYRRLLLHAESFSDTPESVIARLLDVVETTPNIQTEKLKRASRPADGDLLPESEYWVPILEILEEHKGRARGRDVIAILEGLIGPRLTERDRDVLEMGEVRWKNRARFARLRMKELGLVSSESQRGIWEITEKGREYLRAEQSRTLDREPR